MAATVFAGVVDTPTCPDVLDTTNTANATTQYHTERLHSTCSPAHCHLIDLSSALPNTDMARCFQTNMDTLHVRSLGNCHGSAS
jgi:hypothetical protein